MPRVLEIARQTTGRRGKSRRSNRQPLILIADHPYTVVAPEHSEESAPPLHGCSPLPDGHGRGAGALLFHATRTRPLPVGSARGWKTLRNTRVRRGRPRAGGVRAPVRRQGRGEEARATQTGVVVRVALALRHGPRAVPDDARAAVPKSPPEQRVLRLSVRRECGGGIRRKNRRLYYRR